MALVKYPDSLTSRSLFAIGPIGFSGPPGEARIDGHALESKYVGAQLAAIVSLRVTTEDLEVRARWEVLLDGEVWAQVQPSPAFPLCVGNGIDATIVVKVLTAPAGVFAGSRACRVVLFCQGAEPRGPELDHGSIAYDFRGLLPSNT